VRKVFLREHLCKTPSKSTGLKRFRESVLPRFADMSAASVVKKPRKKRAPILATALALASPVWTEDADFFGTGVAVWTTNRIELFLETEDRSLRPGQEE
jgi:hypothetical protein